MDVLCNQDDLTGVCLCENQEIRCVTLICFVAADSSGIHLHMSLLFDLLSTNEAAEEILIYLSKKKCQVCSGVKLVLVLGGSYDSP
jgi:hypothetical protein